MGSIPSFLGIVQSVQKHQEKLRHRRLAEGKDYAAKRHESTASDLQKVISFLESLPQDTNGNYSPNTKTSYTPSQPEENIEDLFSFSEADLSKLPESIVKSLKLSPGDKLEGKIIELLKIAKRPLSVRELIIGLYKRYDEEVIDRNPFSSKLYRMSSAGKIIPVNGKKGYYTLPNQESLLCEGGES